MRGQRQALGDLNINLQERPPQGNPRKPEYLTLLPSAYNSSMRLCTPELLGRMHVCYQFCSALHWLQERVSISSMRNPSFENCCKQGAIVLEAPRDIPEFISNLFRADDALSKHF